MIPWKYQDERCEGTAANHYPTMNINDCEFADNYNFCENCVQFEYCQPCDGSGVGICKVDGVEVFGGSLAGECWRGGELK